MPRRYLRNPPTSYDLNSPAELNSPQGAVGEFRPIEFRTVTRNEIIGDWPVLTAISIPLLRSSPHIMINNKGRIVFSVENGTGIYQLHHMQDSDYSLNLELVRAR